MISIVRRFGAPVMDPPGKAACTASTASNSGRSVPRTVDTSLQRGEGVSGRDEANGGKEGKEGLGAPHGLVHGGVGLDLHQRRDVHRANLFNDERRRNNTRH